MPIDNVPMHLRGKPEELTPALADSMRADFVAKVERELLMLGELNQHTTKRLHELRAELPVYNTSFGITLSYANHEGLRLSPAQAAAHLAAEVNTRQAMLSHGEDPVVTLATRLRRLDPSLDESDARSYAARFVVRLPDGRVSLLDADGQANTLIPKRDPAQPFSEEQWAMYRDGKQQLATATREAMARIASDRARPPVPYRANSHRARVAF